MRCGVSPRRSWSGCAREPARSVRSRARPWPRCGTGWDFSRRERIDMGEMMRRMAEMFRLELMLQVGLATLLGGAIGLERELGGKPAGLRTNILICIGSVLYTHLSIAMLSAIAGGGGTGTDPTRVAGQIVTGVGFIGAGTILHARGAVVGLTSAATIWVVAAIGVALGSGYYLEGIATTLVVLVALAGLGRVETLVERQATRSTITIHAHPGPTVLEDLEGLVRRAGRSEERRVGKECATLCRS